ncbi:unnamed protein product [Amoebophrya sp. A25]|nr:unnamed protein product [Amoebophrya sp. A25]|eukprot:GSA25T00009136001.1
MSVVQYGVGIAMCLVFFGGCCLCCRNTYRCCLYDCFGFPRPDDSQDHNSGALYSNKVHPGSTSTGKIGTGKNSYFDLEKALPRQGPPGTGPVMSGFTTEQLRAYDELHDSSKNKPDTCMKGKKGSREADAVSVVSANRWIQSKTISSLRIEVCN